MSAKLLIWSLKYKKYITYFICAQCIVLYITILLSYNAGYTVMEQSKDIHESVSSDTLYKINDNFIDEEEAMFFAQSDCLSILIELYKWETNNEYFSYIVLNRQRVYIPPEYKIDSSFQYDVEYGISDHYASLQVNDLFFQKFNIKCDEGRLFEKNDYSTNNKVMPILLGYSYKELFSLGDYINLSYLGVDFKCEIVGFLEQGCFFNNGNDLEILDKYVILPSLETEDIYSEDESFMLKLYLDKCSGFISTELTAQELQMLVTQQCLSLDITPFSIEGVSSFYLTMWGIESNQLKIVMLLLAIVIGICSAIAVALNIINKIMERKYEYTIIRSNGINTIVIYRAIFLETFIINLAAVVGAWLFTIAFNLYFNYKLVLMVMVFLSIMSTLPPCIMIKNMCLADSTQE